MNEQPSPEVMAQAKAAGLRRGDSFSYSNDPKAAAAYHPGSAPVTRPDLDVQLNDVCEDILDALNFEPDDFNGPLDTVADVLRPVLTAERARADQAEQRIADAPHAEHCLMWLPDTMRIPEDTCTCWKSATPTVEQ